MTNVTDNELL